MRTVGGRLGFAPFVNFGVAAQVLIADVSFDVGGGADDDDRQKSRIGIDLNGRSVVGHGSYSLH